MTAALSTCSRSEAEEITGRFRDAIGRVESSWHVLVATAIDAYQHRVWTPMGYENWDAYCASEVDTAAVRIPRDLRIEIVGQMSEAGMSTRAIGAAVGAHKDTVRNDLADRPRGESSPPADPTAAELAELEIERHAQATANEAADEPDPDARPMTEAEYARLAAEIGAEVRQPEPERVTGMDGKSYPKPTPQLPRSNRRPITDAFRDAAYDLGKRVKTLTNLAADDRFNRNADQLAERNLSELTRARDALQCVIDQLTT